VQRAAEVRCAQPWARIAHELAAVKAIYLQGEDAEFDMRLDPATTAATAPPRARKDRHGIARQVFSSSFPRYQQSSPRSPATVSRLRACSPVKRRIRYLEYERQQDALLMVELQKTYGGSNWVTGQMTRSMLRLNR
jgi:hypothetical protein